jgi:hypothetical protein
MVRAAGFEPAGNTNNDAVNPASTHRGTHQDSALVKIASAWPTLPHALKAAILAIVNSSNEARPATGLEASPSEVHPNSNFPAVSPSATGEPTINSTVKNEREAN